MKIAIKNIISALISIGTIMLVMLLLSGCETIDPQARQEIQQVKNQNAIDLSKQEAAFDLKLQGVKDQNKIDAENGASKPASHPQDAANLNAAQTRAPLLWLAVGLWILFGATIGMEWCPNPILKLCGDNGAPVALCAALATSIVRNVIPMSFWGTIIAGGIVVSFVLYELVRAKFNIKAAISYGKVDLGLTKDQASQVSSGLDKIHAVVSQIAANTGIQ
jgi:hypothetical protein